MSFADRLFAPIQIGPFAFLRTSDAIPEQRETFAGMATAMAVTLITLGLTATGALAPPFLRGPDLRFGSLTDDVDRFVSHLRYALQCDLTLALPLVFLILRSAAYRFFHVAVINAAARPTAPGKKKDGDASTAADDERTMREYQSIIQNTLEQAVLAALTHGAWAAAMPTRVQTAIPVSCLLFFVGRVGFVAGYSKGAGARALGFALTLYPSVIMLLLLVLNRFFPVVRER